jgi:hypothetical protein
MHGILNRLGKNSHLLLPARPLYDITDAFLENTMTGRIDIILAPPRRFSTHIVSSIP